LNYVRLGQPSLNQKQFSVYEAPATIKVPIVDQSLNLKCTEVSTADAIEKLIQKLPNITINEPVRLPMLRT
jgi:hypothetical protein